MRCSLSNRKTFKIQARHFCLSLGRRTKIMGIVNMTPDSFSGDGLFLNDKESLKVGLQRAQALIRDGADLIDIGGESTRPGAKKLSTREERKRVIPLIRTLVKKIKKPISIDSYKKEVIEEALHAGASMVNDIMGIKPDKNILKLVKKYKAAIVLMHIQGTPRTMQRNIHYKNLINEIIGQLRNSIENCLEIGIKSDRIMIDPGIGFGKTAGHNLEIIQSLLEFKVLNQPILIGPSRKSFIGKVLEKNAPDRLLGTATAVCASILNGADIVRVHDVKEISEVVKMTDAIRFPKRWLAV